MKQAVKYAHIYLKHQIILITKYYSRYFSSIIKEVDIRKTEKGAENCLYNKKVRKNCIPTSLTMPLNLICRQTPLYITKKKDEEWVNLRSLLHLFIYTDFCSF